MTERKPPGIGFETWVDRQIREAAERGAFDDLPGAGKPLSAENEPYDENWWLRQKMRREELSLLPPSLALRKEAENALDTARRAVSERQARRIIAGINEKIREALRTPPEGPPLNLAAFDAERVVREWRAGRDERE